MSVEKVDLEKSIEHVFDQSRIGPPNIQGGRAEGVAGWKKNLLALGKTRGSFKTRQCRMIFWNRPPRRISGRQM